MNKKLLKIDIDIVLNAKRAPDRIFSPSRLAGTLENIIRHAVQTRLPDCDIEVRSLKANWPGAPENFSGFHIDE